jgi:putative transposase
MLNLLSQLSLSFTQVLSTLERAFLRLTQPTRHALALGIAADLPRSKSELITEKALLRQPLIILPRQIKKPPFTPSDRLWLVLLAARVHHWKDTLLILKPDTLLRGHRQGFRLFWKFKSRKRRGRPKLSIEKINLIQQMAQENLL